jgi:GTPase SAR1 family protein
MSQSGSEGAEKGPSPATLTGASTPEAAAPPTVEAAPRKEIAAAPEGLSSVPPFPPPSPPLPAVAGKGVSLPVEEIGDSADAERTSLRVGITPRGTDADAAEAESPPPKAPTRAELIDNIKPVVSPTIASSWHADPAVGLPTTGAVAAHTVATEAHWAVQGKVVRTSAEPCAASNLPISRRRAVPTQEGFSALPSAEPEHTPAAPAGTQLSEVQAHLQQMREQNKSKGLMARYILRNAARGNDSQTQSSSSRQQQQRGLVEMIQGVPRLRFRNRQIFKRKLILLGYQEVGKTSLRKCFESEPFFFRSLPEVRTTTGVEVQEKGMTIDGDTVDIILSDFAGQEAYHSHTYFLTERSIFVLVWKLSAIEQDFQSSGINAREEERLQRWIAEVFAKFPYARIVLVATHLDELRVQGQRSVEMILNKVEGKLRSFIDDLIAASSTTASPAAVSTSGTATSPSTSSPSKASAGAAAQINQPAHTRDRRRVIIGNFAVSCKTRLIIAAGNSLRYLTGEKISGLLHYLGTVAKEDCMMDREYPAAAVPGRHVKLMEDIEEVKRRNPTKLLMRIGELIQMAVNIGIDSDAELLQAARLMHSWDMIYLFNQSSLEGNTLIVLHPRWLNRMAASLFSYAHLLRTPLHLRSMIGGLEYVVSNAEVADMCLMRKGFLRWPLARVLFYRPLADFLRRPPDDADIAMCLELLEAMQLIYPVEVESDEFDVLAEEAPVDPSVGRPVVVSEKLTRYYVPSLAPLDTPLTLKKLAPVLFHRGVRVRFEFNLLPDELWWRFQCKLYRFLKPVTVYQPALGGTEDEDLLLGGYRLREADEEHNRWKDSLWLMGQACRVLVYRDRLNAVSVLSAENSPRGSEEVLQAVEDAFLSLLLEYKGVQRRTYVACPNQECGGWLEADVVASCVSITCPTCKKTFESKDVVSTGAGPLGAPRFSQALLVEAGELLAFCLSHRSCLHMCRYLGIPYKGPSPQRAESAEADAAEVAESEDADGQADPLGTHVEYLHALDKVVQAELFRSWVQRAEEQERRRRMLEDEPTPAFF